MFGSVRVSVGQLLADGMEAFNTQQFKFGLLRVVCAMLIKD